MERAWMRVFAEAGFTVTPKPLLRDCNVPLVDMHDARQLDFRSASLDAKGLLTCADVTVISAVDGAGNPHVGTTQVDGVAIARAEDRKADKYPELSCINPYGTLTVLAMEIAGRWSKTSTDTLAALVRARVQRDPPLLRRAAALAWTRRWSGLLAVALQKASACTMLDAHPLQADNPYLCDGMCLADVLTEAAQRCAKHGTGRQPFASAVRGFGEGHAVLFCSRFGGWLP